ncbi:centromere protein J isoform X2 [Corythoichthys intestinalis]|uniref:centromere protein J isoform X2 n=1 Tax=Corythoichthys intestinalis TaxID=161448 RepID=UPI0025A614C4|nr:centromere protein J isoform X2 [Corythoichthys intestinalis]
MSSSIAGLRYSSSDVKARWTPSITEAGVILNPESLLGAAELPETDDFVPMTAAVDSSYTSVESSPSGETDEGEVANNSLSITDKLDQLRRWQQQLKQQLNADRMKNNYSHPHGLQEEEASTQLQSGQNLVERHDEEGGPRRDGFAKPRAKDTNAHNNGQDSMPSDIPIQAGKQPFEKLLEEQLRLEETRLKSTEKQQTPSERQSAVPPKRAFLRRGQGLSRFSSKASLPKVDSKTDPNPSCGNSEPMCIQRSGAQRKTAWMNKENCPTEKMDARVKNNATGVKVLGCHQNQSTGREVRMDKLHPATKIAVEQPKVPREIPEKSLEEKLLIWESEPHKESIELGEFELLERAAEELSFSSNSSFVTKILQMDRENRKLQGVVGLHQRRLSSTPIKSPAAEEQRCSSKTNCSEEDHTSADYKKPEMAVNPAVFPSNLCFPVASELPYDKRSYQDEDDESEDMVSSISDSDDEDNSTLKDDKDSTAGHVIVFDDDNTWDDEEDTTDSAESITGETSNPEPDVAPALPPPSQLPTSQLMRKLFKPKSQNAPPLPTDGTSTSTTDTTDDKVQQVQSTKLRERLAELELEIEHFKKENAALTKLRQENENIQCNLRKERLVWEQQRTEQLAQFEEYKREETKKLQRERKLFEIHAKTIRAVPDKKEREEIQDDLRKKESRWSAAQNRLRQQIKTLGEENKELRDEVHLLEKLRLSTLKNSVNAEKDIKCAPHVTKGVTFANPLDSRGSSSLSNGSNAAPTKGNSSARARKGMKKSNLKKTTETSSSPSSSSTRRISEEKQMATKEESQNEEPTESCLLIVSESNEADSSEAESVQEVITHPDGKVEKVLMGGDRVILFPNGTKKEVSCDGSNIKTTFFNGDVKEVMADQRVFYYYFDTKTTHITYPDGMEVLHFLNNQTEKHFPDGTKEITFADQTVKTIYADGSEESIMTDGTVVQLKTDGTKEIHFITGQKEVHTADYKRREYPDGTVKTVFADGRQETRYPDGRLRVKDEQGNVLMDKRS